MTEERKGQIAYQLLRNLTKQDGLRIGDVKRNAGTEAKGTDASTEEILEFVGGMYHEILDEAYPKL